MKTMHDVFEAYRKDIRRTLPTTSVERNPYKIVLTRGHKKQPKVMAWCNDLRDAVIAHNSINNKHIHKGYLIAIDRKTGKAIDADVWRDAVNKHENLVKELSSIDAFEGTN